MAQPPLGSGIQAMDGVEKPLHLLCHLHCAMRGTQGRGVEPQPQVQAQVLSLFLLCHLMQVLGVSFV